MLVGGHFSGKIIPLYNTSPDFVADLFQYVLGTTNVEIPTVDALSINDLLFNVLHVICVIVCIDLAPDPILVHLMLQFIFIPKLSVISKSDNDYTTILSVWNSRCTNHMIEGFLYKY